MSLKKKKRNFTRKSQKRERDKKEGKETTAFEFFFSFFSSLEPDGTFKLTSVTNLRKKLLT